MTSASPPPALRRGDAGVIASCGLVFLFSFLPQFSGDGAHLAMWHGYFLLNVFAVPLLAVGVIALTVLLALRPALASWNALGVTVHDWARATVLFLAAGSILSLIGFGQFAGSASDADVHVGVGYGAVVDLIAAVAAAALAVATDSVPALQAPIALPAASGGGPPSAFGDPEPPHAANPPPSAEIPPSSEPVTVPTAAEPESTAPVPIAREPVAPEPVLAEPVAPEPVAPEVVVAEPTLPGPVTAEPELAGAEPARPEAVQPDAVQPEAAQPEPAGAEPAQSEPAGAQSPQPEPAGAEARPTEADIAAARARAARETVAIVAPAAVAPFWACFPTPRPLVDLARPGSVLAEVSPSEWYLVTGLDTTGAVIRLDGGRSALLTDVSGLTRG